MVLADAHLDLAYNAINLGRNLTKSVAEERQQAREHGETWQRDAGLITTTLAEIGQHLPSIVCGTIFILPANAKTTLDGMAYSNPHEANQQAWQQMEWYHAHERVGLFKMVQTKHDLALVCDEQAQQPGLLVLMEGADGIQNPVELERWYAAGLRWLGLAWQKTRYAGGTGAPGGLTDAGIELLKEMQRHQLALDLSHLAEESFWQALDLYRGPVSASHSNCRALLDSSHADRFLSDAMIDAIIERDGVIGLALYNRMLVPQWDGRKESVTLEHLLRHIEYICNRAGNTRHVAIGSDLDGGFGYQHIPAELDTWRDLAKLADTLDAHGWQKSDIANVLGLNWQRWFNRILPT